jgi:hypothetical protein
MTPVLALLVLFLLIGLFARRFDGRARALLLCGIVLLVAYATLSSP